MRVTGLSGPQPHQTKIIHQLRMRRGCTQIFRRSSSDGEVPDLELLPTIDVRIE